MPVVLLLVPSRVGGDVPLAVENVVEFVVNNSVENVEFAVCNIVENVKFVVCNIVKC